jgi:hypothetical protein
MKKSLFKHAEEMKLLVEVIENNNQYNDPSYADSVSALKMRDITIDAYDLVICYNISNRPDFRLETLQVFGKYEPFPPMVPVIKVARAFLGDEHLSLVTTYEEERRVYSWSLVRDPVTFEPLCPPGKSESCVFDGFKYRQFIPRI